MSSSDLAISVRGLSKAYPIVTRQRHSTLAETLLDGLRSLGARNGRQTFWALRDVDFDVRKGQVVGIIGRNGAGKSTLLKILSRITEPTAGEIKLFGRVGSLLEVGTGFHPELTGRENIYLNGAILGMTRAEIGKQFDDIVDFAGVEQFLDVPVKRYSSGMYVRLAFAVAAHLESQILIVDEVLAVGDGEFQRRCLGKMRDVANDGRTVLFVSHNLAAIQAFCNWGVLLKEGRLSAFGETAAVVRAYLSDGIASGDGVFPLWDHPARQPRSGRWMVSLTLCDGGGQPTARLSTSAPLHARLRVRPPRPVRNPVVAIAIEDQHARRITTLSTAFTNPATGTFDREFCARCRLPSLRLGPGRYLISASVSENGTGLLDSIDGAAWFDVDWDNCYPTGAPHGDVYGPVVSFGHWELA